MSCLHFFFNNFHKTCIKSFLLATYELFLIFLCFKIVKSVSTKNSMHFIYLLLSRSPSALGELAVVVHGGCPAAWGLATFPALRV